MKLRLFAVLAALALLGGVAVHVALADEPPPASWEQKNPVRCPYPHEEDRQPPLCDDSYHTPDRGMAPVLQRS